MQEDSQSKPLSSIEPSCRASAGLRASSFRRESLPQSGRDRCTGVGNTDPTGVISRVAASPQWNRKNVAKTRTMTDCRVRRARQRVAATDVGVLAGPRAEDRQHHVEVELES